MRSPPHRCSIIAFAGLYGRRVKQVYLFWFAILSLTAHSTFAFSFASFDFDHVYSLSENSVTDRDANRRTAANRSAGILQGTIVDSNGAALSNVMVIAVNVGTGISRSVITNETGFYQFVSIPVGVYRVSSQLAGFQTQIVENVVLEIRQIKVLLFRLTVGDISEEVRVEPNATLLNLHSVSVGQVVNERTVQEIPLNGRYFIDLGLLAPGSVTPPANGFLSAPTRGGGGLALNVAGNREDTVNFQINGVTLNDQINNTLNFNPPLSSIREFKIDTSTFSPEFGRNSGAIVSVATRSGTKDFHGEFYAFIRNDAFDARNFFNFTSDKPPPFKRNQFGVALGGPLLLPGFRKGKKNVWNRSDRTFFFVNYEGLEQRQGIDINTLVLTDAQRSSVIDPVIQQLVELIPEANFFDSGGAARYVGSAPAIARVHQFSIDLSHRLTENDLLHAFYVIHDSERTEPILQGTTIPGFGDVRSGVRQLLTINETHTFGTNLVNVVRFGYGGTKHQSRPLVAINPTDVGINIGVDKPIGLPQINISGAFNFGGPSRIPIRRSDTTLVFANTVSYLKGRHSLKVGGEWRTFFNTNVLEDTGAVGFSSISSFLSGNANSLAITVGEIANTVRQDSLGVFVQDSFRVVPRLTLDLGFRYDLNFTPSERDNRLVVFDPATESLLRIGRDIKRPYRSNYKNFQPRLGFAWAPFANGRTSIRSGYAIMVEQPPTNAVANTSSNPPLAQTLSFAGTFRLEDAISVATAAGLSPVTIDYNYRNSSVQSWNLNLQHEILKDLGIMIGYFGSKGTHLRQTRNLNQPVNGIRPYPRLSPQSPELPGTRIGNIISIESGGNSSYNALWTTVKKRFSSGFQMDASYTWSKSIDYNSRSSPPQIVTFQDSNNIRNDRGLSDYDARHRFVLNGIFELPFSKTRVLHGWQIGVILQAQTGNPVNIVTSNTVINGISNSIRPDVVGPVRTTGTVEQWFDPGSFIAVPRFGNLGRNAVIGPGFQNIDISVIKNTKLTEKSRLQLRFEVFDALNNANFGQPGRVVGSSSFGRISNTRFPTGDSGSSRQLQFAAKLSF